MGRRRHAPVVLSAADVCGQGLVAGAELALLRADPKMHITLYYGPTSIFSSMARLVLDAKGILYERKEMNILKGEGLTPDYLRVNPHGKVPVLEIVQAGRRECVPESKDIAQRVEGGDFGGPSLAPQGKADPAWRWVDGVRALDIQRITFRKPRDIEGEQPPPPLFENAKEELAKVQRPRFVRSWKSAMLAQVPGLLPHVW